MLIVSYYNGIVRAKNFWSTKLFPFKVLVKLWLLGLIEDASNVIVINVDVKIGH